MIVFNPKTSFECENLPTSSGLDFTSTPFECEHLAKYSRKNVQHKSTSFQPSKALYSFAGVTPKRPTDPSIYKCVPRRHDGNQNISDNATHQLNESNNMNAVLFQHLSKYIRQSEELLCIYRGTEVEKFDIHGLVQINCSHSTNNWFHSNTQKNRIEVMMKSSGTRNSIQTIETNKTYLSSNYTNTNYTVGNENTFTVKLSVPLQHLTLESHTDAPSTINVTTASANSGNTASTTSSITTPLSMKQYVSVLKYHISPAFKVMLLKASCITSIITHDNKAYLKLQVQIRSNPNFKVNLDDIQTMVSLKKLSHVDLKIQTSTSTDTNKNTIQTTPDKMDAFDSIVDNMSTSNTLDIPIIHKYPIHIKNVPKISHNGGVNKKDFLLTWNTGGATSTLPSGANMDYEVILEMEFDDILPVATTIPVSTISTTTSTSTTTTTSDNMAADPFWNPPTNMNTLTRTYIPPAKKGTLNEMEIQSLIQSINNNFPIIVKAKYKSSLITKTKFQIIRTEYDGIDVSKYLKSDANVTSNYSSDVVDLHHIESHEGPTEQYMSKIEYRFL